MGGFMFALNVIVAENEKAYELQKKQRCFVCGIGKEKAFLMNVPEGKVCVKCNGWLHSKLPVA